MNLMPPFQRQPFGYRTAILFNEKSNTPYRAFTTASAFPVVYRNKRYPTGEHLFQAFKFIDNYPGIAEHIRTCSERSSRAFKLGNKYYSQYIRPDWHLVCMNRMDVMLWLKFCQHPYLASLLLQTGHADLIYDSEHSSFWGTGPYQDGRNEFGKALEDLRDTLLGERTACCPGGCEHVRSPRLPSRKWRIPTTPQPRFYPSSLRLCQRILFYDKHRPHFNFTNFSPHKVKYRGKIYPTSEHLFQAMKFMGHRPDISEHIRTISDRPYMAFSEARRFQSEVRSDWRSISIQKMEEVLWLKFTQHPNLTAELLSTGNAELVEDSDKDSFWGIGANRDGQNELGKALERLRTKLSVG